VIHQNDPNDKEFYQLHWLCMSKSEQFLHVLLEGMQKDLAADCCIVLSQFSGKNDCRKTHQDILASGQTFLSMQLTNTQCYKLDCNDI
jgi:hypothetical protein